MNLAFKSLNTYGECSQFDDYTPLDNASMEIPIGYVAVKFNGYNTATYTEEIVYALDYIPSEEDNMIYEENNTKSYEIDICNNLIKRYGDSYWIGSRELPIIFIYKVPNEIRIKKDQKVLCVGGFVVDFLTAGEEVTIKVDGKEINRSGDLTLEALENTVFLPELCYPLYEVNNTCLMGLTASEDREAKLSKHIKCINKKYRDLDMLDIITFINETLLADPLDKVTIHTMIKKYTDNNNNLKDKDSNNDTISRNISLVRLTEVKEKSPIWLFYPYIAIGTITTITGDPGSGKSFYSLYVASVLSNGGDFANADNTMNSYRIPNNILVLNAEDSVEYVMKNRIKKLGGNLQNIYIIDEMTEPFKVNYVKELENIVANNNIRLVILDPVQAYLPSGSNMDSAIQVRNFLGPLKEIAEKHNCSFILVMHQNKNSKAKKIYRTLGSIDFIGLSRSVLSVEKENNKTYVHHIKNSMGELGNTVVFQITNDGIVFLDDETKIDTKTEQYNEAKQLIKDKLLSRDFVSSNEMTNFAKDNGISERTLKRIKKDLSIKGIQKDKLHYWYIDVN